MNSENNLNPSTVLNIAIISSAIKRACTLSVFVYFISLPFVDWKFYYIYLFSFLYIVIQAIILIKLNYKNIQGELHNIITRQEEENQKSEQE